MLAWECIIFIGWKGYQCWRDTMYVNVTLELSPTPYLTVVNLQLQIWFAFTNVTRCTHAGVYINDCILLLQQQSQGYRSKIWSGKVKYYGQLLEIVQQNYSRYFYSFWRQHSYQSKLMPGDLRACSPQENFHLSSLRWQSRPFSLIVVNILNIAMHSYYT